MSKHSPENIHPIFSELVSRSERERFFNQKAGVFWLTGLSGSGKSTIAKHVERQLFLQGFFVQVLDGDNMRTGVCNNLSFSLEDRNENIRRISEVAKLYVSSGIIVLCSFISPTRAIRAMAQDIIGDDDFYEIFVDAPVTLCEERDVKGLYAKARSGLIKGFTGIDSPYEAPASPALKIDTSEMNEIESTNTVLSFIVDQVKIHS
jgi:adenylylsulfate kinase